MASGNTEISRGELEESLVTFFQSNISKSEMIHPPLPFSSPPPKKIPYLISFTKYDLSKNFKKYYLLEK